MEKIGNKKVSISFKIDKTDKEQAAKIYNEIGMSLSTAFNMFIKKSIVEGGLPFEAKDPFYNEANLQELEKRLAKAKNGESEKHQLLNDEKN